MTNSIIIHPTTSTIVPPRLVHLPSQDTNLIECSLHTLPKPLLREFNHVFRNQIKSFIPEEHLSLIAIPTNQHSRYDLTAIGPEIEDEKDRLLDSFVSFAKNVCEKLQAAGFWADFIDPCSGLPMLSKFCNKVYSEVDGMEILLNYRSYNAGFCKILTHPKWGSAVYPATIFARAPVEVIQKILQGYPTKEELVD